MDPRAARRLTLLLITGVAMGIVTYYYFTQEDSGDSDEPNGTQTSLNTIATGLSSFMSASPTPGSYAFWNPPSALFPIRYSLTLVSGN